MLINECLSWTALTWGHILHWYFLGCGPPFCMLPILVAFIGWGTTNSAGLEPATPGLELLDVDLPDVYIPGVAVI